jgi:1-acyl-sn-glycerol-3-phosphate acyltransferase
MNPEFFAARAQVSNPGQIAPWLRRAAAAFISPVVRVLFRPSFTHPQRLPENEPFLLIANHSGGMAVAEGLCFLSCYLKTFGAERPLSALAHPFSFFFPGLKHLICALGVVPSSYSHAYDVLGRGIPLLVFPGGDHEVSRPFWQADTVDFNGRKGFLRIAQKANVPIVPMGITGSHSTAPILWRSRFVLPWLLVVPKLFGLKRFPLSLLGLLGTICILAGFWSTHGWWSVALVYLWFYSLLPFAPIVPMTVTFHLGEPIPPEALFDADDVDLDRAYARVEGAVQALVRGA